MMCDWELQAFVDDQIRRAVSTTPTTASQLFRCPPATPSHEQRDTLDHCVARARAAGLRISSHVRVRWVRGYPGICGGAVRQSADGTIVLALSVATDDAWAFARTCLHELRHCHDLSSGRRLTREDMEVAAENFARAMLARL